MPHINLGHNILISIAGCEEKVFLSQELGNPNHKTSCIVAF